MKHLAIIDGILGNYTSLKYKFESIEGMELCQTKQFPTPRMHKKIQNAA